MTFQSISGDQYLHKTWLCLTQGIHYSREANATPEFFANREQQSGKSGRADMRRMEEESAEDGGDQTNKNQKLHRWYFDIDGQWVLIILAPFNSGFIFCICAHLLAAVCNASGVVEAEVMIVSCLTSLVYFARKRSVYKNNHCGRFSQSRSAEMAGNENRRVNLSGCRRGRWQAVFRREAGGHLTVGLPTTFAISGQS